MSNRHEISRRDFARYAACGAASIYLHGCASTPRRVGGSSAIAGQPLPQLTDRDTFRQLADAALNTSSADHILVSLNERIGGLTQFHNDQITDHADNPNRQLSVTVAFGRQVGSATTDKLTADAVVAAVISAQQDAEASLPNPDYLPPLPPRRYPVLPTYRPETAEAGRTRRAADASEVTKLCASANLQVLGIIATSARAVGIAADTGLFAFEQRTLAELDITSVGSDVPIKIANVNRSIDDLGVVERTRQAVAKTKWLAHPRELTPGRYTVILEPTAVAQLLRPLLDATAAHTYHNGTSALRDKLGEPLIDSRFTLRNRPDHPALIGNGFDAIGLPTNAKTWIERGVLTQLHYDRLSAHRYDTPPTFAPDAWHLSSVDPTGECIDDLVRATEHGILVTNLDQIKSVDPSDLTLTGQTRDGTFLIEDGKIVAGLTNLNWRESPLRAFNQVRTYTTPLEAVVSPTAVPSNAVTSGVRKLLVPAITINDFNMEE